MDEFKNNNNPEETNGFEDRKALYDIELEDGLSEEVSQTIETLKKEDEINSSKRKRGRPRKMSGKKDAQEPEDGNEVNSMSNKENKNPSTGKRVSSSFTNLLIFGVIFAALVGAQFVMKMEEKDEAEKVTVSSMEITPEENISEKVAIAESTDAKAEAKKEDVAGEKTVAEEAPAVAEIVREDVEKVEVVALDEVVKTVEEAELLIKKLKDKIIKAR